MPYVYNRENSMRGHARRRAAGYWNGGYTVIGRNHPGAPMNVKFRRGTRWGKNSGDRLMFRSLRNAIQSAQHMADCSGRPAYVRCHRDVPCWSGRSDDMTGGLWRVDPISRVQ